MAEAIEWFTVGSQLVQAIAWPVLLLCVVVVFRSELGSLIEELQHFSFKGHGVEFSAERSADAASAATAAILKQRLDLGLSESDIDSLASDIRDTVHDAVERGDDARSGGTVLWVDDNPTNNVYERKLLDALGIDVVLSDSTNDALDRLRTTSYDVIISDMGREESERAGYDLLEAMDERGIDTPFIIYAGSDRPEHKRLALSKGAIGSTNRPRELLDLVQRGIARSRT